MKLYFPDMTVQIGSTIKVSEKSISFWIGPEFPTFFLCLAFGMEGDYCYRVDISINGSRRTFKRGILFKNSFDHLWFFCRPQSSLQK